MKTVLTIGGSDSGGGAGIQADLKTFEAHRVFGLSVVTAVTAQHTGKIFRIHAVPASVVAAQLKAVFSDFNIAAVKISMLYTRQNLRLVARCMEKINVPVILDPLILSTSGSRLLRKDAWKEIRESLVPHVSLLTPNIYEAGALAGMRIRNEKDILPAAKKIAAGSPELYVLIKGGHLPETGHRRYCNDYLFHANTFVVFTSPFIPLRGKRIHGAGCTFAAAITANLAKEYTVPASVRRAKAYITRAIRNAPEGIGKEARPLYHHIRLS